MVPVTRVCAQAVRAGAGLPLVTEVGVWCLGQWVPAGGGVDRRAVAAPSRVVAKANIQAACVLRQNLWLVSEPSCSITQNYKNMTYCINTVCLFYGLKGLKFLQADTWDKIIPNQILEAFIN